MKKYTVYWVLFISLIMRLLIYFNTTHFRISEAGSILDGVARLRNGDTLFLFEGSYSMALSFLAYGFDQIFGSLHFFFIFQCLLATLTLFIVHRIIFKLTSNRNLALGGLILASIYMDYAVLSSIAYNQLYEVLFASVSILIILQMIEESELFKYILLAVSFFTVQYISLLFRGTLKYVHIILLVWSLYTLLHDRGKRHLALRLSITFLLFTIINSQFSPAKTWRNPDIKSLNNFIFFGHTDYGGLGGEGAFIYEENEERYSRNLKAYLERKGIEHPEVKDIRKFQSEEIKKFFFQSPHRWVFLQAQKLAYTYGAVPVRDSLQVLVTGKQNAGLFPSVLLIQLTFFLPLFILILFFDLSKFVRMWKQLRFQLFIVIGIYLVIATTFYGHYSERYRIVVMVCALIPLSVMFFDATLWAQLKKSRKALIARGARLLPFMIIWGYQIFDALVTHRERYQRALELMK